MFTPLLERFPSRLVASLRFPWIIFHTIAIVLTALLVLSGIDWAFFLATRGATWGWLVFGAGIGGFFVPVLAPLALYLWGEARSRPALQHTALLIAQAEGIAWLVSSTYKVFTGRIQPEFLTTLGTTDISHAFQFGFLKHGIFWGWPSSHAAVAFAGAFMLVFLARSRLLAAAAIAWAVFVALGAAIGFHWLSDALAGALIGYAIARSIAADVARSDLRPY